MKAFILRFIVVFIAAFAVLWLLPGIIINRQLFALVMVGFIAAFNAMLKPFLTWLSLGCSILALGPILVVANTIILWLFNVLSLIKDTRFMIIKVDNFWPVFWAGLVISIVSFTMDLIVSDGP